MKERYGDDISIFGAIKGLIFGAPLVAVIDVIGNTAITVYRLPWALVNSYKALWRENRVGPRVKTVVSIVLPAVGLLVIPLGVVGSVLYGIGIGFWVGSWHGLGAAKDKAIKDLKWVKKNTAALTEFLSEFHPEPLPEGKKPFDIKIWEGVAAFLAAAICCPIGSLGGGLVALRRVPSFLRFAYDLLLKKGDGRILRISLFFLCFPASVIAVPFITLAGAIFGIGKGCQSGYKKGFIRAIRDVSKGVDDFRKAARDFFETHQREFKREKAK